MQNLLLFFIHFISYWITALTFIFIDSPVLNFERRFQDKDKNYKKFANGVLQNQLFLSLPMALSFDFFSLDITLFKASLLAQLPMIFIIHDFFFYHFHRACHSRYLFKYHKKHHELIVVNPVGALYAGSVEHIFINTLPAIISPKIIGAHYGMEILWTLLATINVVMAHTGRKHFSDDHELHHKKKNVNFGLGLYFFDKIYKTYKIK